MTIKLLLAAISLTVSLTALPAANDTIATVNHRIASVHDRLWQFTDHTYANPAFRQWMLHQSYSDLRIGYFRESSSEALDIQKGSGSDFWQAKAQTYMKHRSSTLWGEASYSNGHQRDIRWNESSDTELVYPYFTADSIGGDMKMERYQFSGGYADHTDRWAWGAGIGYAAGLYYRAVDPRPRNVTGRLDVAAGGAYRIGSGDYRVGASLNFRKYKQTSDLTFMSELGDEKVYHTTGLGNHYTRFAGKGYSTYYDGHRIGWTLNLFPTSHKGGAISFGWSRFEFDHILTGLNKLPMASVTHTEFNIQAAWLAPGQKHDLGYRANIVSYTRSGTENLFGDPAANIYPRIGSSRMYTDKRLLATLSVLWQWHVAPRTLIWARPEAGYDYRKSTYAIPSRHISIGRMVPCINAGISSSIDKFWQGELTVTYRHHVITNSSIDLSGSSTPSGLADVELHRYTVESNPSNHIEVKASASRAIGQKHALQLSACYGHGAYTRGIHSDITHISISYIF